VAGERSWVRPERERAWVQPERDRASVGLPETERESRLPETKREERRLPERERKGEGEERLGDTAALFNGFGFAPRQMRKK
jgi:hypothetical protein